MQNAENTKITENQVIEKYSNGPVQNNSGSVDWTRRVRRSEIEKFWMNTVGVERLEDDETVRITAILPYEKNGKLVTTQRTLTEQVRDVEELMKLMEKKYNGIKNSDWKKLVGWSMSSARFKYIPEDKDGKPVAPTKDQIISLTSMVIDIDSHTGDSKGAGRFHFNSYSKNSRRLLAASALCTLNNALESNGLNFKFKPFKAYATGGGLQYVIKFERPIYKDEADKIFTYIKRNLNLQELMTKKQEKLALKDPKGAKKLSEPTGKFAVTGADELDNIVQCFLEFDASSGDIAHTQRIGGTINPKEAYIGSFSEEIEDLYNEDLLDDAKFELQSILDSSSIMDEHVAAIKTKMNKYVTKFKNEKIVKKINGEVKEEEVSELLPVDKILLDATIFNKTAATYSTATENLMDYPNDYEILKKIPSIEQAAFMGSFCGEPQDINSRYIAYLSPFVEENNASFAIYKNEGDKFAFARSFHDDETYNAITFLMKLKEIPRNRAIKEIVIHFRLELGAADRKNIHKEENEGTVSTLISKINTEDYVYYRLANKNRMCIIREFAHGEAYTFDGTRMMSDHVLLNQLGVKGADLELRAMFHDMFVEKVLINAFEEFRPGKPYTYERNFIKYINLWIPGKEYLKIHENAKSVDQMDLASAIEVIKERLPNSWYYLNQITQKGSLAYFINWLVCVGRFEIMSTIPVLTSTQGTGKGVFVTQILEYYLNHEYVNTVTADKLSGNFNAFMEKSSLLILDEGDFSRSRDVDFLKLLTGNKYIQLEKKGVDSSKAERHFNMIMTTNGDSPMMHPSNDRRMTYFRLDVTLLDSIKHLGFEYIDDFIDALKDEVQELWTILVKTTPKREWINQNLKDNQFNKQILMMHPFGRLVIKIIEGDWADIQLQLNENTDDSMVITANLEMVKTIKETFERDGTIDLTLINRYIKSLPFKSYTSVQQFININALGKNGITTITTDSAVKIHIDQKKLLNLIKMSNNLGTLFECYNDENYEKTLALVNSHEEEEKEARVYATTNPQIEIEEGLKPMDTSDPLGIMKPPSPSTIIQ